MFLLFHSKRLDKSFSLLFIIPLFVNISLGNPKQIPDARKPVHIMFLFVDHYEPNKNEKFQEIIARPWLDSYSLMADKHRDADGFPPRHTWFFLYFGKKQFEIITEACYKNYGEIEVHVHHGDYNETGKDQTSALEKTLQNYLDSFSHWGALVTAEQIPKTRFGFIHGGWGLDNSRYINGVYQYCGVNEELRALKKYGCYADFTFPSWGPMCPQWSNKIFYSKDDPRPKSYDYPENIREVEVGIIPSENEYDLMLIQGPRCSNNIGNREDSPSLARMKEWVAQNVYVKGRPEWIFVKVYTHSCSYYAYQSESVPRGAGSLFWGDLADKFYTDIENEFNDGRNYQLHYVTAREAYNIIKAAEAGMSGNPGQYRDFLIKPYSSNLIHTNFPYKLHSYTPSDVILESLDDDTSSPTKQIWLKNFDRGFYVYNSGDGKKWKQNLSILQTGAGEIKILDETPSLFYRISREKLKRKRPFILF